MSIPHVPDWRKKFNRDRLDPKYMAEPTLALKRHRESSESWTTALEAVTQEAKRAKYDHGRGSLDSDLDKLNGDSLGLTNSGKPRGMSNSGAMCYRNSALQILLNVPAIVSFLNQPLHKTNCANSLCLFCALQQLSVAYHEDSKPDVSELLHNLIAIAFQRGWAPKEHYRQQDSEDFMYYFISSIFEDLEKRPRETNSNVKNREATSWNALLGIEQFFERRCLDCYARRTYPPYFSYMYQFSLRKSKIAPTKQLRQRDDRGRSAKDSPEQADIQQPKALQELMFASMTDAFDDLPCPSCKYERGKLSWQRKFLEMPEILLIQPERNFDAQSKDNTQIRFQGDERLDLSTFAVHTDSGPSPIYEIVGAVFHRGLISRGHYINIVKVGQKWYECNDDRIRETNINDWGKSAVPGREEFTVTLFVFARVGQTLRPDGNENSGITKREPAYQDVISIQRNPEETKDQSSPDLAISLHGCAGLQGRICPGTATATISLPEGLDVVGKTLALSLAGTVNNRPCEMIAYGKFLSEKESEADRRGLVRRHIKTKFQRLIAQDVGVECQGSEEQGERQPPTWKKLMAELLKAERTMHELSTGSTTAVVGEETQNSDDLLFMDPRAANDTSMEKRKRVKPALADLLDKVYDICMHSAGPSGLTFDKSTAGAGLDDIIICQSGSDFR